MTEGLRAWTSRSSGAYGDCDARLVCLGPQDLRPKEAGGAESD